MGDNVVPQESWNMAQATMQRLSRILDQCSMHAQNGMLVLWYSALMDLRRNLSPFLEETEFNNVRDKLLSLPSGWNINGKVNSQHYSAVNRTLDEIFIILICCMKSKGLLMPKSDDPRAAVIQT